MTNYKYSSLAANTIGIDYGSPFTFSGLNVKQSKSSQFHLNNEESMCDCICTSLVVVFAHLLFIITLPFSAIFTFKLICQYERLIVYRLGRLRPVKGPGVVFILPFVDRWQVVDLRTKAFNVPPCKVCTTDGCIVSIGAIIHFRIKDPLLMSLSIQDVDHSMRDCAMTDMANLLSKKCYNDVKTKRLSLAYDLQFDINQTCSEWGLEASRVELSDITLIMAPQNAPSSFMPMYGAAPPPTHDSSTGFGDFAQLARQFLIHVVDKTNTQQQQDDIGSIKILIDKVQQVLHPTLLHNVDASYEFEVAGCGTYYLDLHSPPGSVGSGKLPSGNPDVKISLSAETLRDIFNGSLTPTRAYAFNKLAVVGDIAIAKKLDLVVQCLN